jgi:UDP:flavonoid glycosyltransferase YjiC (YdhE family)
VPPNARVEPWWPQADVLREASAVVGHGGFSATTGALRAGVPQVVVPLFAADQAVNARHVAAAGAGLALGPSPDAVLEACRLVPRLLSEPSLRDGARAAAAGFAALPDVAAAVEAVHALAA